MTEREELATYIWDASKEACGVRPRWLGLWDADGNVAAEWTLERLRVEADTVSNMVDDAMAEEEAREAEAAARMEKAIARAIAAGARDRRTAIRWLLDADDCCLEGGNNDAGYFEYLNGLPYGWVKANFPSTLAELI